MTDRNIHASIAPEAVEKVTRFFNAGVEDQLRELLQNARRSGASEIRITATDDGRIAVQDDGCGIERPEALLTVGETGWTGALAEDEDAAGMGFYALAKSGAVVRSRAQGQTAWTAELTEAAFTGAAPAWVRYDDSALPAGTGTRVDFRCPEGGDRTLQAAADCARYHPTPVVINGKRARQDNFLEGALGKRRWEGLEIGVFRAENERLPNTVNPRRPESWKVDGSGRMSDTLNFHGMVTGLPDVPVVPELGAHWSVRIDVQSNSRLKLTLPARKEVLRTPELDRIREAARETIYQAIRKWQAAGNVARLPWTAIEEARQRGIVLESPPEELYPYQPDSAERWRPIRMTREKLKARAAVVTVPGLSRVDQHCLAEAMGQTPTDGTHGPHLYRAEPAYEGYGWYDRLSRVVQMTVRVQDRQGTRTLDKMREQAREEEIRAAHEGRDPENGTHVNRTVDSVQVVLHISNSNGNNRRTTLPGRIAFQETGSWGLERAGILLDRNHGYQEEYLAELLEEACSPGSSSGSWEVDEIQDEERQEEAWSVARELLQPADEQARQRIEAAVQEAARLVPEGQRAVIRIERNGTVDVVLEATTGGSGTDAPQAGEDRPSADWRPAAD